MVSWYVSMPWIIVAVHGSQAMEQIVVSVVVVSVTPPDLW
ncbi:hypothetical protein ABI_37410 [Asticcacaulis biprosthecium C19]|uniref:Uncharacterized protein n=1 Tax=Asticcacaulis biprosthecium C19 TaxID=715226 RepID=F4QR72_9CAUL|nr:hypothetical protein ABI_37410 [Asticcacaulis biprosthecium C19]